MRQLIYASWASSHPDGGALQAILEQSRHNNALDGVSGLLWSDGERFLQVLEGTDEAIASTMARIRADPRHHGIDILSDAVVEAREFGDWSMEHRRREDAPGEFDLRMKRVLTKASENVRNAFTSLIAVKKAA